MDAYEPFIASLTELGSPAALLTGSEFIPFVNGNYGKSMAELWYDFNSPQPIGEGSDEDAYKEVAAKKKEAAEIAEEILIATLMSTEETIKFLNFEEYERVKFFETPKRTREMMKLMEMRDTAKHIVY